MFTFDWTTVWWGSWRQMRKEIVGLEYKEDCCLKAWLRQFFSWLFWYSVSLSPMIIQLWFVFIIFFNILFTIRAVIPPLFMIVIISFSLQPKVTYSPFRFCPIGVVSHLVLGPWWQLSRLLFEVVCAFVLPLWWLLYLKQKASSSEFE